MTILNLQLYFDRVEISPGFFNWAEILRGNCATFPFPSQIVHIFLLLLFKGVTQNTLIKKKKNPFVINWENVLKYRFQESFQSSSKCQHWKLGRCLIIIAVFQIDLLWFTKTMKSVAFKDLSYIMSEYPDLYAIFWDSLCLICLCCKHGNTSCSHNSLLLLIFHPFLCPLIRVSEAVNMNGSF